MLKLHTYKSLIDLRYRFNATSHSLASVRIPLASNSHSIEYMYYWARTRSRARARKENGASSVENLKNDTNGA